MGRPDVAHEERRTDAERRERYGIERSLSYARWAGAGVAVVQASLFKPAPDGRPSQIPLTYAVGGFLVLANLILLPALRRRRVGPAMSAAMFGADIGAVGALVWLYLDNPDATQWVLFMIVQLEAAYRWEMRGALGTAAGASLFYTVVRYRSSIEFDFAFTVDSITYVLGLTLVQAFVVGGMARRMRSDSHAAAKLHEAALALNAQLDRRAILQGVAEETARLMTASMAVVWIPEGDDFVPAALVGLREDRSDELRLPAADPVFGESTVGAAFRSGVPSRGTLSRGRRSGQPVLESSLLPKAWRSVCSAPILYEGKPLGVLSCYTPDARSWEPQETARLEALSALAAVAMTNAAAYERERSALESMRALDTLKDDFLSTVSHELRTPLTVVEGFATTLRSRWADIPDERRRDLVGRIETQSRELHERIRDLLEFSRLRSGKVPMRPVRIELRALVSETVNRLEPVLAPHPVEIDVPADAMAWVDPTAVGTILENLLINAARYSPPAEPLLVRTDPGDGGWIDLSVVDRGLGVPAEEHERIFERFYRGQQDAVRRVRGTGIGLAIVKELAKALGGGVSLVSAPGEGPTFTVRLPALESLAPVVDDIGQADLDAVRADDDPTRHDGVTGTSTAAPIAPR